MGAQTAYVVGRKTARKGRRKPTLGPGFVRETRRVLLIRVGRDTRIDGGGIMAGGPSGYKSAFREIVFELLVRQSGGSTASVSQILRSWSESSGHRSSQVAVIQL